AQIQKFFHGDWLPGKLTDSEYRTVQGYRRNYGMHSFAARKTGVHNRLERVDHPVTPGSDLADDIFQFFWRGECFFPGAELPFLLNEDLIPAIYHNLSDGVIF